MSGEVPNRDNLLPYERMRHGYNVCSARVDLRPSAATAARLAPRESVRITLTASPTTRRKRRSTSGQPRGAPHF